ncbi:MAG: NADH-ubiquinone oxidoreductase chain L, partial [uncultured Acetobacteraceae bacterium]
VRRRHLLPPPRGHDQRLSGPLDRLARVAVGQRGLHGPGRHLRRARLRRGRHGRPPRHGGHRHLDRRRRLRTGLGAALRHAGGGDGGDGHGHLHPDPPLQRRLHVARRDPAALLRLPVALHLHDADAGDGGQPRPALLRLGRRGPRELPPHRLLVRPGERQRRGHEGLYRQPGRRLLLHARRRAGLPHLRQHRLFRDICGRPAAHGRHLPRAELDRADRRAAVPRRLRQIGAARPAHLASGRHGGADAGFRADPRRDDGDGRGVPGVPHVAADGIRAERAHARHLRRRLDRVVRRHDRVRAERHQAHHRLLHLFAARLYVLRGRGGRLPSGDVPPLHPRLLQGAALPGRRQRHPRHVGRAGHPPHGRHLVQDPRHLRRDVGRQPGPGRHPVLRGLLFQGRHPGGGVRGAQLGRRLRLPVRHPRGLPDGLLFVASAHPHLPRRAACRRAHHGACARKPGRDAGAAAPPRGRRGAHRVSVLRFLRGRAGARILGRLHRERGPQPRPARHARGPSLGAAGAHRGRRARHRPGLLPLHGGARPAGAAGSRRSRPVPLPVEQVVLRRALRPHLRQPRPAARLRVLEGRRRPHHRRDAERRRRPRRRGRARRRPHPDRARGELRLRHDHRPRLLRFALHARSPL